MGHAAGFLGLAALTAVGSAAAETGVWELLGPGGGPDFIRTLVVDPTNPDMVFAGTGDPAGSGQPGIPTAEEQGVFRSTNGGDRWERVLGGVKMRALLVDPRPPQSIYAGTQESGIFQSLDGGGTWRLVAADADVRELAWAPGDRGALFAATGAGLRRSNDRGATWAAVPMPPEQFGEGVDAVVADLAGDVYASTSRGLWRSVDGGDTWSRVESNLVGFRDLLVTPDYPGWLYAVAATGSYRSSDGGRTWQALEPGGSRLIELVRGAAGSGVLHARKPGALMRSDDGGDSWRQIHAEGRPVLVAADGRPELLYGTYELYATWHTAFCRSRDGGFTWDKRNRAVEVVAVRPGSTEELVAAGPDSIYLSDDGGVKWTTSAGPPARVRCLVFDPHEERGVFAGTDRGVYHSTDGGRTWESRAHGIEDQVVLVVLPNPARRGEILAGTLGGIVETADGGRTWIPVDGSPPNVQALLRSPDASVWGFAGTREGVYRSTDARTWSLVLPRTANGRIGIARVLPHTLYAAYQAPRASSILQRSRDLGTVWRQSAALPDRRWGMEGNLQPVPTALAVDPEVPPAVVVATAMDGMFGSTDGGGTWHELNRGMPLPEPGYAADAGPIHALTSDLAYASTGHLLFAATERGVYRVRLPEVDITVPPAGGADDEPLDPVHPLTGSYGPWRRVGPVNVPASALAVAASDHEIVYLGGRDGHVYRRRGDGFWLAADAGLPRTSSDPITSLAVHPHSPDTVYAGLGSSQAVARTEDGGAEWRHAHGDLLYNGVSAVAFGPLPTGGMQELPVYASVQSYIFRRDDGVRNWSNRSEGFYGTAVQFVFDPHQARRVYAPSPRYPSTGLFVSEDSGDNWRLLSLGAVRRVAVDPVVPGVLYAVVDGALMRSTDGADGWRLILAGPEGAPIQTVAADPLQEGLVYATYRGRVMVSANRGESWLEVAAGLPDADIPWLASSVTDVQTLYAATDSGLYAATRERVGGDGEAAGSDPVPATVLFPAYPNPAPGRVKIAYSMSGPGAVRIDVFDAIGQPVMRLGREHAAAGQYEAVWDGDDLDGRRSASGVYFVRLVSRGQVSTRRIVLLSR